MRATRKQVTVEQGYEARLTRNLAVQSVQRLMPFRFIGRLARLEIDANGTEIGCATFLWGAAEDVLAPCNFKNETFAI